MDIQTYVCGACTTASIANLGYEGNALNAMKTFLKQTLCPNPSRYGGGRAYSQMESFYVYTAGPEEPGHGHSKSWVKYGTEFTQFIKDNNLGVVVSPGRILNAKYHSTTYCETWVWRPDRDACIKWWEKHMDLEEMEAKLKAQAEPVKVAKAKADPVQKGAGAALGGLADEMYAKVKGQVIGGDWGGAFKPGRAVKPGQGQPHPPYKVGGWDWADGYAAMGTKCSANCGNGFAKGDPFLMAINGPVCEKCAVAAGAIRPWIG